MFFKIRNYIFSFKFGQYCFYTGLFLLASAPLLSAIFLLYSTILGVIKVEKEYKNNKFNYIFLVCTIILIMSAISHIFFDSNYLIEWNYTYSFIGLSNLIPYFICFSGFQSYLKTKLDRKRFCLFLIFGSIPIVFSGFTQTFLGWYGPYEIFNGLIIWYQRQMPTLTGLFNNPNYTSAWLVSIIPFSIGLLIKKKKNIFSKLVELIIFFLLLTTIILTGSRSGWLGSMIAIFLSLNFNMNFLIYFILSILTIFLIDIGFLSLAFFNFLYKLVPIYFKQEFQILSLENLDQFTRLSIWKNTLILLKEKPLFGYGASSFTELYANKVSDIGYAHAHNLFLELAISYGVLIPIILLITFIYLIYKSSLKIKFFNKYERINLIDRSLIISAIIIVFTQLLDVQYYDFRIGVLLWLLMSSLKCIIDHKSFYENNTVK